MAALQTGATTAADGSLLQTLHTPEYPQLSMAEKQGGCLPPPAMGEQDTLIRPKEIPLWITVSSTANRSACQEEGCIICNFRTTPWHSCFCQACGLFS